MESAGNPNEQGRNTEMEPAVGNAGNEDTSGLPADNPESEPQQVTHSSNIQVSDHAEEEVQDAPKDWRQQATKRRKRAFNREN